MAGMLVGDVELAARVVSSKLWRQSNELTLQSLNLPSGSRRLVIGTRKVPAPRGRPRASDHPVDVHDEALSTLQGYLDEATLEGGTRPVPGGAIRAQLQRAARARREFAEEFGLLTSREVAEYAGSEARNPSSTASRWVSGGRIFSVKTARGELYPALQFQDGVPRPVISDVLQAFGGKATGWSVALWFSAPNSWLGGARPADLLEQESDTIVTAAVRAANEIL